MFNKDSDVYTPERVDVNAGRKKIAVVIAIVLVIALIGWQVFKPDGPPGGTPTVQVDQTGQTPGAKMYTPVEQQSVMNEAVEADGVIEGDASSVYGTVEEGIQYLFTQLAREDNPKIDGTDNQAFMARMREEGGWENSFYDEVIAFELMQLFNLTASETLTEEERVSYAEQGTATGNPTETYELIGDGVVLEDITEDTPYYVIALTANYKTETSLPVLLQANLSVTNEGRIFAVTPVGIQSQTPEGA